MNEFLEVLKLFGKIPATVWIFLFTVVLGWGYIRKIQNKQIERVILLEEERRKHINKLNGELYKKYSKKLFPIIPVTISALEEVIEDANILLSYAKFASSNISNTAWALSWTLDKLLIVQKNNKKIGILTTTLYDFFLFTIQFLDKLSSNPVPTPSIFSLVYTKKKYFINRKLKKFVPTPKMKYYKFISLGLNIRLYNQEIIFFYNDVLKSNDILLMLSCSRALGSSTIPLERILFQNEIYFPPIISINLINPFSSEGNFRLVMIGFKNVIRINDGSKRIQLLFTTKDSRAGIGRQKIEKFLKFKDEYLNINFQTKSILKDIEFKRWGNDIFEYEISQEILNSNFISVKKEFGKKMKKQLK